MSKRRIQAPAGRTKAPSNRSYQGPVDATVKQRLLGHVRINCVCTKGAGTPIVRFMGQHAGAQPQTNESTEHRIERLLGELETEGQVEVERDGGQIVRVSLARPAQSQDAPAAVEAVHWEPKQAALRDLALIMLVDSGGELLSESGQVARLIRDHYGLPDVHTKSMSVVLRLMADDGLITRTLTKSPEDDPANSRRTYAVRLVKPMPARTVAGLRYLKDGLLAKVLDGVAPEAAPPPAPQPGTKPPASTEMKLNNPRDYVAEVYADLMTVFDAIKAEARDCERRNERGDVAIVVSDIEKRVRFRGLYARALRYYLRELELAGAKNRVEGERYLYWWSVDMKAEVSMEKLEELLRDRDFITEQARLSDGESRKPGKVKRDEIGNYLRADQVGPVTVRRVDPATLKRGQVPPPAADPFKPPAASQPPPTAARKAPAKKAAPSAVAAVEPAPAITPPDVATGLRRLLDRVTTLKQELADERAARAAEVSALGNENEDLKLQVKDLTAQLENVVSPDLLERMVRELDD